MSKAANTFVIGIESIEGAEKYESKPLTLNGVKGRMWTRRVLKGSAWVLDGQRHIRTTASESEVCAKFAEYLA